MKNKVDQEIERLYMGVVNGVIQDPDDLDKVREFVETQQDLRPDDASSIQQAYERFVAANEAKDETLADIVQFFEAFPDACAKDLHKLYERVLCGGERVCFSLLYAACWVREHTDHEGLQEKVSRAAMTMGLLMADSYLERQVRDARRGGIVCRAVLLGQREMLARFFEQADLRGQFEHILALLLGMLIVVCHRFGSAQGKVNVLAIVQELAERRIAARVALVFPVETPAQLADRIVRSVAEMREQYLDNSVARTTREVAQLLAGVEIVEAILRELKNIEEQKGGSN